MRTIFYLLGAAFLFLWVTQHPGAFAIAGLTPEGTGPNSSCQVTVTTDGTPPDGMKQPNPDKLCNNFSRADSEKTAACMGNWQPPEGITARELCITVHQHGCGDPQQDCNQLPTDSIYHASGKE